MSWESYTPVNFINISWTLWIVCFFPIPRKPFALSSFNQYYVAPKVFEWFCNRYTDRWICRRIYRGSRRNGRWRCCIRWEQFYRKQSSGELKSSSLNSGWSGREKRIVPAFPKKRGIWSCIRENSQLSSRFVLLFEKYSCYSLTHMS